MVEVRMEDASKIVPEVFCGFSFRFLFWRKLIGTCQEAKSGVALGRRILSRGSH